MTNTQNVKTDENIFEAVQENYKVKEVAEQLGISLHRVGACWLSSLIQNDGTDKDAFAIYKKNNRWHDVMWQGGQNV